MKERYWLSSADQAQAAAGATRLLQLNLSESACPPGSYGVYDGLAPCKPCAAGSFAGYGRTLECELCPRNMFAARPGSFECIL